MKPSLRQALATSLVLVGGLAIFKWVELSTTPLYDFTVPLDRAIPFLPATLPLYLAFFPYLLVAAWRASPDEHRDLQGAILLAFVVALGCFWMLPAAASRPDPALITNHFLRQRFTKMWGIDAAHNTFPSLHVAATMVAMRVLGRQSRLALGFGVLVCISTLTVKQHTVLDVVGGCVLASSACAAMAWARRRGRAGVIAT